MQQLLVSVGCALAAVAYVARATRLLSDRLLVLETQVAENVKTATAARDAARSTEIRQLDIIQWLHNQNPDALSRLRGPGDSLH